MTDYLVSGFSDDLIHVTGGVNREFDVHAWDGSVTLYVGDVEVECWYDDGGYWRFKVVDEAGYDTSRHVAGDFDMAGVRSYSDLVVISGNYDTEPITDKDMGVEG